MTLQDDLDYAMEDPPAVLGAPTTIEATKQRRTKQRIKRRRAAPSGSGSGSGIEMVYEPHQAVLPPVRDYLSDLWGRRAFLVELAKSDIRGARASTVLGSLWSILDPLFMAAIYLFVFTILRGGGGGRTEDFVPLIVAGILHFQLTTAAISEGGNSISGGKMLMLNSTFPRALLPLMVIYKSVLKYLPSVPIILLAIVIFNGTDELTLQLLWFPVLLGIQLVGGAGFALLFATILVFVPDMKNMLTYLTRLLFFSTPIIYPVALVPETISVILRWSPIFGIFESYQHVFSGDAPNVANIAIAGGWAMALLLSGAWIFMRYERRFASKF